MGRILELKAQTLYIAASLPATTPNECILSFIGVQSTETMDSDSQLDPSIRRADLLSPGAQPDSHLLLGKTWIPPYRNELYLNRAWSSNIFLHKAPPAKAEPEGEFAEERTCLNLKLLGEAYFMNIHEGGLAKSSVSVCELQQKVEEMQTGTVCVHNEAH